jgi:hypothetical protein
MEQDKKFSGKPLDMADEMANTVPKNFQEAFTKVVKAGMKVMFSEQTHQFMIEELQQEGDLAQRIGEAISGLMLLLYQKSNNTMPGEVVIPAGVYLLGQGADFLEKVTGEEITPDILAGAMQVMIETLSTKFGVDPKKLYQASEKAAAGEYK